MDESSVEETAKLSPLGENGSNPPMIQDLLKNTNASFGGSRASVMFGDSVKTFCDEFTCGP